MHTPLMMQVQSMHFNKFVVALRNIIACHPDTSGKMFQALDKLKGLFTWVDQNTMKHTLLSPKALYYLDALLRHLDSNFAADQSYLDTVAKKDAYLDYKMALDQAWADLIEFSHCPSKGLEEHYHTVR